MITPPIHLVELLADLDPRAPAMTPAATRESIALAIKERSAKAIYAIRPMWNALAMRVKYDDVLSDEARRLRWGLADDLPFVVAAGGAFGSLPVITFGDADDRRVDPPDSARLAELARVDVPKVQINYFAKEREAAERRFTDKRTWWNPAAEADAQAELQRELEAVTAHTNRDHREQLTAQRQARREVCEVCEHAFARAATQGLRALAAFALDDLRLSLRRGLACLRVDDALELLGIFVDLDGLFRSGAIAADRRPARAPRNAPAARTTPASSRGGGDFGGAA
jgi:hypothetical protein